MGCLLVVKLSQLYQLKGRFEKIPPYCQRAHLDFSAKSFESDRILGPIDDAWTPLAKRLWPRYLTCGDPHRDTTYYAWQIRPQGKHSVVKLEEFGQVSIKLPFYNLVRGECSVALPMFVVLYVARLFLISFVCCFFLQDLHFDLPTLRWVAGRPRKSSEYAALNKNRENRLLAQFFASVGINVAYEIRQKGKDCKFETLVSALHITNHVGYIRKIGGTG